jgi:hypothetical protein
MSKTLFIHIPKTAGTSIAASCPVVQVTEEYLQDKKKKKFDMDPNSYRTLTATNAFAKHTPYSYLDLEKISNFDRVMTVIRNPWSRLVSFYNFVDLLDMKMSGTWYNQDKISWVDFLSRMENFKMTNSFYWNHPYDNWGRQSDWIDPSVDVLRYENLQEDVNSYFGKNIPLLRKNVGLYNNDYKDYYTEEQKEKVAEWFKPDIDKWGFSFDSGATKNYWTKDNT